MKVLWTSHGRSIDRPAGNTCGCGWGTQVFLSATIDQFLPQAIVDVFPRDSTIIEVHISDILPQWTPLAGYHGGWCPTFDSVRIVAQAFLERFIGRYHRRVYSSLRSYVMLSPNQKCRLCYCLRHPQKNVLDPAGRPSGGSSPLAACCVRHVHHVPSFKKSRPA